MSQTKLEGEKAERGGLVLAADIEKNGKEKRKKEGKEEEKEKNSGEEKEKKKKN